MNRSVQKKILVGIFVLLALRFLAILIIPPGGDEVVHLYIADDIAHFIRFPIYFYDQAVMGTLESFFIVPFFKLFGFSFLGGRIYYSFFYLSFMVFYLWIVRRSFSRELTTYLFILLAILPFPALFFTTVIGWAELPLLSILSLVLLLTLVEKTSGAYGWPSFGLGFVCAIALWCNPLFIIWLVPIGISLIGLSRPKGTKLLLGFSLGFLVGLVPIWIHGLQTGVLMSVKDRGGTGFVTLRNLPRVVYFFFARMKYFLSTFSFGSVSPGVDRLIQSLSLIPFLIFSISFGSLVFYFFRSRAVLTPKEKIFYIFLIFPPLLLAALYCSRNFTGKDEGMRFFVQLLIPYAFAVAWWLERLRSQFWKRACLSLLVGILLLGNIFSGREAFRRTGEFREVVRFLEKEGLRFGIADLGIAYPVNVLSRHRILATPLPHHALSHSIWEKVKAEGPRFLILERQNPQLRKELANEANLKMVSIAGYDIFYGESDYLKALLDIKEPILG